MLLQLTASFNLNTPSFIKIYPPICTRPWSKEWKELSDVKKNQYIRTAEKEQVGMTIGLKGLGLRV